MSPHTITAVIPVYNGAHHIGRALESVFRQTLPCSQVIVVDDGSTDGSADVIRSFPDAVLIRQPNSGVAVARNTALAFATGGFIAFLDQDDEWVPAKNATQVRFLDEHPELGFTYCRIRNLLDVEKPEWLDQKNVETDPRAFLPGSLFVRRDAFQRVGFFDPSFVNGSDTDWLLRARDRGVRHGLMDDVLLLRHIHELNESRKRAVSRRDMFVALHGSIRRRKAGT